MQFAKGRAPLKPGPQMLAYAKAPEIELLTGTISPLEVVEFYW
jgi:hypothetical protein